MNTVHNFDARKLFISVAICELAGVIGAFFTTPAIGSWYALLTKPSFTPPSWFFPPTWVLLYMLMGIGMYVVWAKGFERPDVRNAMRMFAVQLFLNILWPLIFFGNKNIGVALACIIALWISIALSVVEFGRISRKAAIFLFPYLAWVSFAFFLNYAFWVLNP